MILMQDHENMNNLVPVANQLVTEGVEIEFMHMDNILHQDIASYLPEGSHVIEFPVSTTKSFYLLKQLDRIRIILRLLITPLKSTYKYLLTGRIGILEYVVIKKLLKNNEATKVYSIQDAIIIYPESNSAWKRLRKYLYFTKNRLNICDRIYVSGDVTKESMIYDGVDSEKIIVTGLPRFNVVEKHIDENLDSSKVFLFITGAHRWNGFTKWGRFQEDTIDVIKNIFQPASGYEIWIKQHPRDDYAIESDSIKVINDKSIKVEDVLNQVDYIFASVSPSTILFQAINMGKKVFFVEYENLSPIMPMYETMKKYIPTINISELKNYIEKVLDDGSIIDISAKDNKFLKKENSQSIANIVQDIL